jgi:hypothetical protein
MNLSSALSIRGYRRLGSRLSAHGLVRLTETLSLMDTQTVVSVLSFHAAFRLSQPDWVFVDGALSVASSQKISDRLSVEKASHYGESLSTRSFANAGGTLSGCGPASYAIVLSVVIQSSALIAGRTDVTGVFSGFGAGFISCLWCAYCWTR